MFPQETTTSPATRRRAERLFDLLGAAVEFATLGEATFDPQAPTKLRYLPHPTPADDPSGAPRRGPAPPLAEPAAAAARDAIRNGFLAAAPGEPARGASAPARTTTHPHRTALRAATRPRRPGAIPARPPVCTAPVPPTQR